jgi:hypothetical protein
MTSDASRHLSLRIDAETRTVKGFTVTQWQVVELAPGDAGPQVLALQLYMTERTAYRHNLTAAQPRLFLRCDDSQTPVVAGAITASQEVAAGWMDGDWLVLDTPMPLAVQAWLEAYLVRHGEAPDEGRKKKRKGAGRARENLT